MDLLRCLPFPDDVKAIILDYDAYPREVHASKFNNVLKDVVVFYMINVIHNESMLSYGFNKLYKGPRYKHFTSGCIYW